MIIVPKRIKFYQEGGAMGDPNAEQEAPEQEAPEGGQEQQDPMMQLAQMAQQALQANDGQMALQVCDALLQLLQQAQGGAPAEPQSEPVFKRGGKIAYRIRK